MILQRCVSAIGTHMGNNKAGYTLIVFAMRLSNLTLKDMVGTI